MLMKLTQEEQKNHLRIITIFFTITSLIYGNPWIEASNKYLKDNIGLICSEKFSYRPLQTYNYYLLYQTLEFRSI